MTSTVFTKIICSSDGRVELGPDLQAQFRGPGIAQFVGERSDPRVNDDALVVKVHMNVADGAAASASVSPVLVSEGGRGRAVFSIRKEDQRNKNIDVAFPGLKEIILEDEDTLALLDIEDTAIESDDCCIVEEVQEQCSCSIS